MPAANIAKAVFLLMLTQQLTALTYYVHPNCRQKPRFEDSLQDAIALAAKTRKRNAAKDGDPLFQHAFYTVMRIKQDASDTVQFPYQGQKTPWSLVDYIFGVIESLVEIAPNTDLNGANVRFWCDDDPWSTQKGPERWQLVPDDPEEDEEDRNSARTDKVDREWFDQYNWMQRDPESIGCKDLGDSSDDDNGRTQMEVYAMPVIDDDIGDWSGYQRPPDTELDLDRSVVSMCDWAFNLDEFPIRTFGDIPPEYALEDVPMTAKLWSTIISATLIHELTHIKQILTSDVAGKLSYYWVNIVGLEWAKALLNGENYMFLAILAELLDWKIRLDADQTKADQGLLVRDTSIESRVKRRQERRQILGSVDSQFIPDFELQVDSGNVTASNRNSLIS